MKATRCTKTIYSPTTYTHKQCGNLSKTGGLCGPHEREAQAVVGLPEGHPKLIERSTEQPRSYETHVHRVLAQYLRELVTTDFTDEGLRTKVKMTLAELDTTA